MFYLQHCKTRDKNMTQGHATSLRLDTQFYYNNDKFSNNEEMVGSSTNDFEMMGKIKVDL